jgi:hypothetical protein
MIVVTVLVQFSAVQCSLHQPFSVSHFVTIVIDRNRSHARQNIVASTHSRIVSSHLHIAQNSRDGRVTSQPSGVAFSARHAVATPRPLLLRTTQCTCAAHNVQVIVPNQSLLRVSRPQCSWLSQVPTADTSRLGAALSSADTHPF